MIIISSITVVYGIETRSTLFPCQTMRGASVAQGINLFILSLPPSFAYCSVASKTHFYLFCEQLFRRVTRFNNFAKSQYLSWPKPPYPRKSFFPDTILNSGVVLTTLYSVVLLTDSSLTALHCQQYFPPPLVSSLPTAFFLHYGRRLRFCSPPLLLSSTASKINVLYFRSAQHAHISLLHTSIDYVTKFCLENWFRVRSFVNIRSLEPSQIGSQIRVPSVPKWLQAVTYPPTANVTNLQ